MATDPLPLRHETLREALQAMERALGLLDEAGAPAHIGAHLDLAICELRSLLERTDCGTIRH